MDLSFLRSRIACIFSYYTYKNQTFIFLRYFVFLAHNQPLAGCEAKRAQSSCNQIPSLDLSSRVQRVRSPQGSFVERLPCTDQAAQSSYKVLSVDLCL